jgi:glycosyltransferase involved in cell wall biosynthesis
MTPSLSVVVLTKNEEKNICDCLRSVFSWADEIIIVDDGSQEGKQRNYGASQAKHDWIFMLDADERMTPDLQKEIDAVLKDDARQGSVAYWVPRKNYLGGYWLRYGGWYPAPHIKLYNKNYVAWKECPEDVVHPGIEIRDGFRGATLTQPLTHFNFVDIEDFIGKVNRQSTLEALKWYRQGKNITFFRAIWKSVDRFLRRYIRKRGLRDGYYGFVAAVLSGFYQFAAYSKLWELKRKESSGDLNKETPR